ncbi:MAG: hypothetical protein AAGE94_08300, partial [Acidobacteriota bacterium]
MCTSSLRILIVESRRLFVDVDDRAPTAALQAALRTAGHTSARLALPSPHGPNLDHQLGLRDLVLSPTDGGPELVLALDRLAARLRHPRRVLWAVRAHPIPIGRLRDDTALAVLDRRVGAELVATFAASNTQATTDSHALGRPVPVLAVPADGDAIGWQQVTGQLLDAAEIETT